jgi:hypothetical protein
MTQVRNKKLTDTKERWNWQVERAQRTGPPGPDGGQGSFRILFLSSPQARPTIQPNAVLQLFKMTYG